MFSVSTTTEREMRIKLITCPQLLIGDSGNSALGCRGRGSESGAHSQPRPTVE